MPREDRRLYFDHDESYQAIYALCSQKNIDKPVSGVLKRVDTNIENILEINFYIENSKTLDIETVSYAKDFVTAALMALCTSVGVPIAKRGNKLLEIIDGKLVLRLQILR